MDLNRKLFRQTEREMIDDYTVNKESVTVFKDDMTEAKQKRFPTIFTCLCSTNDAHLISKLIPFANEESIQRGVEYAGAVGAAEVLQILLEKTPEKNAIGYLDNMFENAMMRGDTKIVSMLAHHSGIDQSDVVNLDIFKRARLLRPFLPNDISEMLEHFEKLGKQEESDITPRETVESPFVQSIGTKRCGRVHVIAVDESYPDLSTLVDETITATRPEHVFLPLSPEDVPVMSFGPEDGRKELMDRIEALRGKNAEDLTDENRLQKTYDLGRWQREL